MLSQRVLSTYIIECKVSITRFTIMVWSTIPHVDTWDPWVCDVRKEAGLDSAAVDKPLLPLTQLESGLSREIREFLKTRVPYFGGPYNKDPTI